MPITLEEESILAAIRDKLSLSLYMGETNFNIVRVVTDAKISKSIREDTVTNV